MNNKGLTLIEVILTIALVGIISTPLFTLFITGLNNIIMAGDRTDDVLLKQEIIDQAINVYDNSGTDEITIIFTELEDDITGENLEVPVTGMLMTINSYDEKIKLKTFVPNH